MKKTGEALFWENSPCWLWYVFGYRSFCPSGIMYKGRGCFKVFHIVILISRPLCFKYAGTGGTGQIPVCGASIWGVCATYLEVSWAGTGDTMQSWTCCKDGDVWDAPWWIDSGYGEAGAGSEGSAADLYDTQLSSSM